MSSSVATSASYATTASYAESASYAISSSAAISASYATTASYADSASIAISSSQSLTASHLTPVTNLYVNEIYPTTGNSANRIFTENVNTGFGGIGDTVIYTSIFDINLYPGAGTRAVKVTGSLGVSNGITGSLQGTASFATSATSASYADNANLLNGLDSSTFTSTASFQNYTSSTDASISSINTTTASLNTRVGTLEAYTSSLNAKTSSFATTGSNTFNGTQTITGSLNISGNIVTPGTITAQTLIVQTITSSQDFVTGSTKFGTISANTHQFTGSVSITGSLNVNGPLTATSLTGSLGGSNIVDASVANTKLTNSSVTINGTSLSLGGTLTQAQTIAGAFSGSAQVDHNTTTNYVANQHIDHTTVSVSAGSGLSGGGTIAATRTLTLDTGSVHFLDGVKKELNTEGVVSSSAQIDHNATTNYVANRHIDHTAVTITAGSGLSGGGDISATRTLSIATSGVTDAMLAGSISNAKLTNSTISGIALGSNLATLTIGTGLSGTSYNGSGAVTIANTITNNNQLTNGAGYQTTSGTVAKVEATVAGSSTLELMRGNMADNDHFRILVGGTAGNAGYVEIATADDSTEPIHVRQYSGVFATLTRTATLLDSSGNTTFPGSVTAGGDVTAFSDASVKENIKTIENALDKVLALRGVTYNRIDTEDKSEKIGVIAQETREVVPQVVFENEEGKLSVAYGNLGGLFIEAFKQQQLQIEELKELKELVNQLLNK